MSKPLPYTEQELYYRHLELLHEMSNLHREIFHIGSFYTGISAHLGASDVYNSPFCSAQLSLAFILSDHALISELLQTKVNFETFNPEPLREAQILSGMRILDMGCGYKPTFARSARRFGAEVYTADLIPADQFIFEEKCFCLEDRGIEAKNHICGNLREAPTLNAILQISGEDFDLVTEAHLDSGQMIDGVITCGFQSGRRVAQELLAANGYWDNPWRRLPERKR